MGKKISIDGRLYHFVVTGRYFPEANLGRRGYVDVEEVSPIVIGSFVHPFNSYQVNRIGFCLSEEGLDLGLNQVKVVAGSHCLTPRRKAVLIDLGTRRLESCLEPIIASGAKIFSFRLPFESDKGTSLCYGIYEPRHVAPASNIPANNSHTSI